MTLLQAGRDLLARGGVPELYQGLGVTLVGSMPAVGIYFGLYQFVKKQMDSKKDMSPYISITVSAGVGNFIARFEGGHCVVRFDCGQERARFFFVCSMLRRFLSIPPPCLHAGSL